MQIWPQLKGRVFHRTSLKNYSKIINSGFIDNNQNEKYQLNWNNNSFFKKRGYVSVCDLYNNTRPRLTKEAAISKYNIFGQKSDCDNKFVFLFLSKDEYQNLVTWQEWLKQRSSDLLVPYLESGYPEKILLSSIEEIWFFEIKDRPKI